MNKLFIRQIFYAVALAVIASGFNSVQAQTTSTFENLVLRNSNVSGTYTSDGTPWHDLTGYWVDAITGEYFTGNSITLFEGKTFYLQDINKTKSGYSTINISKQLEVKANVSGITEFAGDALYVGYYKGDIYNASGTKTGSTDGQFSTKQMRLSLRIDASGFNDETQIHYDPDKAVVLSNVYLGNGIINNRLIEGDYVNYATVGLKGTLNVLPDPNIDSQTGEYDNVFRSVIANDNKNRHIVVDESAIINVPAGAKLEFRSESWDNNESHHPYSVFPVYGNVEGNGRVRYKAIREDTLFVYGTNNGFTEGTVNIFTDDDNNSTRYDHSYVISGNGAEGTGIKGSAVHIECGNLLIQNDHTLNNLSSDPIKYADELGTDNQPTGKEVYHYTRILAPDKLSYNTFVDVPDGFIRGQDLGSIKLTLNNTQETTYYGSIGRAKANVTEVTENITEYKIDYIQVLDEHGNPVLTPVLDEFDNPVYDGDNPVLEPVLTPRLDENGEPVLIPVITTVVKSIIHDYEHPSYTFTSCISELEKTGNETLNLYCAGSDGGIQAESFVVSSGRINFNGVFQSMANKAGLNVKAGAVFSPDSWGWGGDDEIVVDENPEDENDFTVTINGNVKIDAGGRIEFNFSDYNSLNHDVITIGDGFEFGTSITSIIDLDFMSNDPYAWATENAEYLLIKGGGFPLEETDYSDLLINTYGNMQTLRQFGLLGKDGNLYLVTRYYVPEPSTWALLILGAAGLLYWRRKNGRR